MEICGEYFKAHCAHLFPTCSLPPACPHDLQLTKGFAGLMPAGKGFIDIYRQARRAGRHGVYLIAPQREGNDLAPYLPEALKAYPCSTLATDSDSQDGKRYREFDARSSDGVNVRSNTPIDVSNATAH